MNIFRFLLKVSKKYYSLKIFSFGKLSFFANSLLLSSPPSGFMFICILLRRYEISIYRYDTHFFNIFNSLKNIIYNNFSAVSSSVIKTLTYFPLNAPRIASSLDGPPATPITILPLSLSLFIGMLITLS